ncbi:MAG: hypothetical protein RJA72_1611 [Pseudomonadota bacterium]
MLLLLARRIQSVAIGIARGFANVTVIGLTTVIMLMPMDARATQLPGDIRTLSCVASKLGELVLRTDPHPGLRAWAVASLVKDAYGVRAFEAEQLELLDPEAAKSKRAEAIRSLRLAKEAGWAHLKGIALDTTASASDELALAYWTAAAWGALIALDRDDFDALADWPKAKALADWVRRQQADFGEGAALMLAASFEFSSPGGDKAQAKRWFADVLHRYGARQAMLHVLLAEQLDLDAGDRQAFEARLRLALSVAHAHPSFENRVAASKARWLLSRIDELF